MKNLKSPLAFSGQGQTSAAIFAANFVNLCCRAQLLMEYTNI